MRVSGDRGRQARPAHARRSQNRVVGVDVGVRDLLVVATAGRGGGGAVAAPKPLTRAQSRLRAAQRQAARRCGPYDPETKTRREPSKRWAARHRAGGADPCQGGRDPRERDPPGHHRCGDPPKVVAVERLSVKNMGRRGGRRKRGLNRALGDAALGRIRSQLDYKTTWYGTKLVTAPRFFPSTQLCSRCGAKTKLRLRDRIYHCRNGCPPIDRDLNAAINLARLGDPIMGKRGPVPAVGRPPASRLEMDVEPSTRPAPPPPGAVGTAGGDETSTPHTTHPGAGTAAPQGEAA